MSGIESEKEKGDSDKKEGATSEKEEDNFELFAPSWLHPALHGLLLLSRSPLSLYSQPQQEKASEDAILQQGIASILWSDEEPKTFTHDQRVQLLTTSVSLVTNSSITLSTPATRTLLWITSILCHDASLAARVANRVTLCQLIHASLSLQKEDGESVSAMRALEFLFRHILQDRETLEHLVEKSVQKSFKVEF